ncbi:MAG: hypothetical protein CSA83_00615 [Actinomycetales bacterium]|nr:MAG: hypothetical protein CSA83_00615 [Actinomycetales bacterium]
MITAIRLTRHLKGIQTSKDHTIRKAFYKTYRVADLTIFTSLARGFAVLKLFTWFGFAKIN